MQTTTIQFLKACSLSVALLGSVAVVAAISLPDEAYANNGNGKGNGGGNGNGGGSSKGSDNGAGKGGGNGGGSAKSGKGAGKDGKAAESKKVRTSNATAPEVEGVGDAKAAKIKPKEADSDGVAHPSELGALNAAHANARALENAAPNSRVGRIAAYRDAVLAGQELTADLEEKVTLLGTLTPPDRSLLEIDADLALANADLLAKTTEVGALQDELAAAGGIDPAIEAQLDIAIDQAAAAGLLAAELKAEQTAAVEYTTLTDEVADLTQKVADQPLLERTTLEAAANKPVTDDVEATVKALLGL